MLTFKTPTPQTEQMFENSFNVTLDRYQTLLKEQGEGTLKLANENFDTGGETGPGKYGKNDEAHATLLANLAKKNFASAPAEIRRSVSRRHSNRPKKSGPRWQMRG